MVDSEKSNREKTDSEVTESKERHSGNHLGEQLKSNLEFDTLSANYNNAISHLYRGEMQRTYNWRKRLDRTTNWAVILIAATLTWTFSSEARLDFVLLISMFFILFLAVIESRRYAVYIVYKSRLRVLEENFMSPLLRGEKEALNRNWKNILSRDLREPTHKIGFLEAFSRRLRRVYVWLISFMVLAWFAKISIHPSTATSLWQVIQRASVGPLPGKFVFIGVIAFLISVLATSTYRWSFKYGVKDRQAKGHLKPQDEEKYDWREV